MKHEHAPWSLFAATLVAAFFVACGSGDLTLDEADPAAVDTDPTYDAVFAIMQRECVPCHTDSDDENDLAKSLRIGNGLAGEGAAPDLRNCNEIVAYRSQILDRVITKNDMPPGAWPRLTSEEKLLLQRWVDNGAAAPCN